MIRPRLGSNQVIHGGKLGAIGVAPLQLPRWITYENWIDF